MFYVYLLCRNQKSRDWYHSWSDSKRHDGRDCRHSSGQFDGLKRWTRVHNHWFSPEGDNGFEWACRRVCTIKYWARKSAAPFCYVCVLCSVLCAVCCVYVVHCVLLLCVCVCYLWVVCCVLCVGVKYWMLFWVLWGLYVSRASVCVLCVCVCVRARIYLNLHTIKLKNSQFKCLQY